MLTRRTALAAGAAAMLADPGRAAEPALLLRDGVINGVGWRRRGSLLIQSGRIVAMDEYRALSGKADRVIDLKGAAVFPGFTDSHAHLQGIGMRELTLSLEGTASISDLITRLRAWAAAHPGTDPISGRGWIETHWPEARFPNAADLDKAVADRPVVLTRADGHALVANTAALRLGGVMSAQAPAGGQILRNAAGEPTGMLIDNAMGLVTARMPPPSAAVKREALRRGASLYAARGWTGLHNMSVSGEDWRNLLAMRQAGELPLRIDNYLNVADAEAVFTKGPVVAPGGLLAARGVKIYMDGALGSRGAALLEPYADAEGLGLLTTPPDQVSAVMRSARVRGIQVAIHAIGDRGNRLALDLMRDCWKDNIAGLKRARWRVEHAQILDRADIPRFSKLGVTASMQPSHAIGDLYFAPARLGARRLEGAYAWRSLYRSGALIAGGSDAPVEKGDPLVEFYAAAYRHDLAGKAGADWNLREALPRPAAMELFTWNAARAAFRDEDGGRIGRGRTADITVFDTDLMTADFAAIPKARALLTLVGGRTVHNAL